MKIHSLLKTLGPGILFASTAIGVSHLVQSTRAGAEFSFGLVWAILLANLFKYPFFEFGSRYANVTGRSLIHGYLGMSKAMFWIYVLVTLFSMFFVSAAVGAVTAGFMANLFGLNEWLGENTMVVTAGVLFVICIAVLTVGKYKALDRLIKVIGSVLLITTLISFFVVLARGPQTATSWESPMFSGPTSALPFLIALMGWMPTAVDLSTWNSLWTIERIKDSGYKPKLKETLFDFNFGYLVSALLAICFVTLGAYLFYGATEPMPTGGVAFSNAVISLYTSAIGQWSYMIIAAAGFSIMFGTCIAVFDGYARAAECSVELIVQQWNKESIDATRAYRTCVLITAGIAFLIIYFAGANLKSLVDLATTISFLIAPVIAGANLWLVLKDPSAKEGRPPLWLRWLSYLGLTFLTVFSLIYLSTQF